MKKGDGEEDNKAYDLISIRKGIERKENKDEEEEGRDEKNYQHIMRKRTSGEEEKERGEYGENVVGEGGRGRGGGSITHQVTLLFPQSISLLCPTFFLLSLFFPLSLLFLLFFPSPSISIS